MPGAHETGSIQSIEQISKLAKKHNIIFHTDAVQSAGKIPVGIDKLGVDLLSIAGHKIYAPKGIGALYIRQGINLEKLIHGAGQENSRRAGTENVLEIVGLGMACEIARRDFDKNVVFMKLTRDRLYDRLKKEIKNIKLNCDLKNCLPNTLNISFKGIDSSKLIDKIKNQLAVSSGAACHSGKTETSYVLKALNVSEKWAKGTIRFSTGKMTTIEEIDYSSNIIINNVLKSG